MEIKTTLTEVEHRTSSGENQFFRNFDKQHVYTGRKQDYLPLEGGYDMESGSGEELGGALFGAIQNTR